MTFHSRFKIGDAVWHINISYVYDIEPCSACASTGVVLLGGEHFPCPKCNGTKQTHTRGIRKWTVGRRFLIHRILLEAGCGPHAPDGYRIQYLDYAESDEDTIHYPADQCFATEEEAKAACDMLNAAG